MRKIISSLVLAFFLSFSLVPIEASIAADEQKVVGFEIIAPTTAVVNEAIDITVRAIDKDKNTVKGYNGSIIFISDTFGDTIPSPGKAIAFTTEDAWQKKFSKGVIFRSSGKQKIYVADVDNPTDTIDGQTTVTVSAATSTGGGASSTETVTIVTPVKDSKITTDMVTVSGQTKKNSKVVFILNGKEEGTAITEDSGLFSKTLSWVTQEKNLLQVQLLDGSNAVIAQSEEIVFERATDTTGFYNLVMSPSDTLKASTTLSILVEGEPAMSSASVSIDGALITLTEKEPGKYTTETVAPAKAGSYPVTVSMLSSLWQSIEKKNVATLTVTDPVVSPLVPRFSNVKTVTEGTRVIFSFEVLDAPDVLSQFKIAYGESADALTQEVMTYTRDKIQGTGGVYSWYIDKLEPKTYTFKIFGAQIDTSLIPELVSEPITVTVGKDSISVANVWEITIEVGQDKSTMTWAPVECALSYNIYKINAAGDYVLIENIKEPKYTLYFQKGPVTYDDFAVKALCEWDTESVDYSRAVDVQTGPAAIAILVILSGVLGMLLMRKKSLS